MFLDEFQRECVSDFLNVTIKPISDETILKHHERVERLFDYIDRVRTSSDIKEMLIRCRDQWKDMRYSVDFVSNDLLAVADLTVICVRSTSFRPIESDRLHPVLIVWSDPLVYTVSDLECLVLGQHFETLAKGQLLWCPESQVKAKSVDVWVAIDGEQSTKNLLLQLIRKKMELNMNERIRNELRRGEVPDRAKQDVSGM